MVNMWLNASQEIIQKYTQLDCESFIPDLSCNIGNQQNNEKAS